MLQDDAKAHRFGGAWTRAKLAVLEGYLGSYTTALKDKPKPARPFRKIYIDAFAGSGYIEERRSSSGESSQQQYAFPDLAEADTQAFLDGSARIALKTTPRFERYIFIEKQPGRCAVLETLRQDFPHLAEDIEIRQEDANEGIRRLCRDTDWRFQRAVLFLDPYGMQVEWSTIEAIAQTKAIDLWLLFPLGMGVNRLLKKSGDIPESWRQRLSSLLGTDDWYDEFYKTEGTRDLFGERPEYVVKATTDTIDRYFIDRLKTVFVGVADPPGVLRNSRNNPLYLLCFAAGNEKGSKIAIQIANHLLRDIR